jgi:arylsulfatase A-like enzyme
MFAIVAIAVIGTHPYFSGIKIPEAGRIVAGAQPGPVVLVVVDALRPDHLTPYGYQRDTTPNLAALSEDGVLLTDFVVNGNWTRPSTASLLTGLLPAQHGVQGDADRLAAEFKTLAELLETAQIPTGAVVGNGNAGSAFGLGRGFSFYADTVAHWDGLPTAEQVIDLAIPFVDEHKKAPFFLLLFLVDPHDPYGAPAPYEDMFVQNKDTRLIRTPHWELGRYSVKERARMMATYDGAIRYSDAQLGRFIDHLKATGAYDRTTLIVTADHGEGFGEHGIYLHSHHLYEEIVRAPLIVRYPRMSRRGVRFGGLFQTIDLWPTIAGLYGIGSDAPGVDLTRAMATGGPGDRRVVCLFQHFGIARAMVRTRTRKVIYHAPADRDAFLASVGDPKLLPSVSFENSRIEMYDLSADPRERTNLAGKFEDPEWASLVAMAKGVLVPHGAPTTVIGHLDPETARDQRALGYLR